MKKNNEKIAIIGGGISGITASVLLIEKGYKVDIFEAKKNLGGRAGSIQNKNITVDIGQHIFLPSYKTFLEVLDKLGLNNYLNIEKKLNIPIQYKGKKYLLKSRIPFFPLNMMFSVIGYKNLKFSERIKIIICLYKLSKLKDNNSKTSFLSWLKKNGQNNNMIKKFWDIICKPAFNSDLNKISINHAKNLFKLMIFDYKKNVGICYFKKPFSEIIEKKFHSYLKNNNSNLFKAEKIEEIKSFQKKISLRSKKENYIYDKAIVATNLGGIKNYGENLIDNNVKTDSIINIYFWFDKKIIDEDFISFSDSKLEWVFSDNKLIKSKKEYRISISISAANNKLKIQNEKLILEYEKILRKELNISKKVKTIRSLIIRSPKATQIKMKNNNIKRKNKNIYFVGDWTLSSLPNTMETAALSSKKLIDNYFK